MSGATATIEFAEGFREAAPQAPAGAPPPPRRSGLHCHSGHVRRRPSNDLSATVASVGWVQAVVLPLQPGLKAVKLHTPEGKVEYAILDDQDRARGFAAPSVPGLRAQLSR